MLDSFSTGLIHFYAFAALQYREGRVINPISVFDISYTVSEYQDAVKRPTRPP
jgi:hypothetical protein